MPKIYFFLSYARGDDRASIKRFFEDLSTEVRAYAGLAADVPVGYLDVEVEMGAAWSSALMRALRECANFIALVSPRYLISEPCGREWAVFSDRLHAMEMQSKSRQVASALIPLLWLPPNPIPEVVARRQYHNNSLPEAYERTGLRQIIRLQRHHDDYLDLLVSLAHQIVTTARTHKIPPSPEGLEFHQVASAFHTSDQSEPAAAAHPTGQVYFVIAAPSRGELESGELADTPRDPRFYGERAQEWAPYWPDLDQPLAEYAHTIAVEHRFQTTITDLPTVVNWVDRSANPNLIVVLLIDLWSTKLASYRQALTDLVASRRLEELGAVMVPASHEDPQTQAHLNELIESLNSVPGWRALEGRSATFRSSILSPQAFGADLRVLLEGCRNRIFSTGKVFRRPPGRPGVRPILRGP